jgi:hypothetical protein
MVLFLSVPFARCQVPPYKEVVIIYVNGGAGINNANVIASLNSAATFLNGYQNNNTGFYPPTEAPTPDQTGSQSNVYDTIQDAANAVTAYNNAGIQTVTVMHGVYSMNADGTPNAFQGEVAQADSTISSSSLGTGTLSSLATSNSNNSTLYCGMSNPPTLGTTANGNLYLNQPGLRMTTKMTKMMTIQATIQAMRMTAIAEAAAVGAAPVIGEGVAPGVAIPGAGSQTCDLNNH